MSLMIKLAKYKAIFAVIFVLILGLVMAPAVFTADAPADDAATENADPFGLDPIQGTGEYDGEEKIALGTKNLQQTIVQIINVALGLLGIVSVVIVLIGGFKWMTAGGNEEQVGEARKWIFSGIIGLAIIMSAWAIAKFVLVQLGQATGVAGTENYSDVPAAE
ncbi:MAG: pilin [Candidatus Magasanikiibacteriota bacterium]